MLQKQYAIIEVLGFKPIGLVLTPPVYGMIERDGIQIHFGKSDTGAFSTNENFRNVNTDFIIWVPQIDAFYAEVSKNGAEIIQEITLQPYGSREFKIKDCNGYRITIGD